MPDQYTWHHLKRLNGVIEYTNLHTNKIKLTLPKQWLIAARSFYLLCNWHLNKAHVLNIQTGALHVQECQLAVTSGEKKTKKTPHKHTYTDTHRSHGEQPSNPSGPRNRWKGFGLHHTQTHKCTQAQKFRMWKIWSPFFFPQRKCQFYAVLIN